VEQFKIAEAYVEFKGVGNVEKDAREAQEWSRRTEQKNIQSIRAVGRAEVSAWRAKKIGEMHDERKKQHARDTEQAESRRQDTNMMKIGLATRALSSLPFARGIGDMAAAYQRKGAGGALATAASAGVAYGIGGAAKASPQAFAQMQFQADRLQAIVGQSFVPIIEKLGTGLERFSNLLGGKGAQLNMPQLGNFESMRDRLQMEAVAGMAGGGGGTSGLGTLGGAFAGGKFGAGIGARFGPWGAVIGGGAGAIVGGVAGDSVEALASRGYRSIMNALD